MKGNAKVVRKLDQIAQMGLENYLANQVEQSK